MRSGSKGLAAVALLAAVATASALGLTASNTVAASTAGAGEGTISGYVIDGIAYTLDSTSPDTVSAVRFEVDGEDVSSTTAFAMSAKLDDVWSANCDTRTYAAGPPSSTAVSCSFSGTLPSVETASTLRVVVAPK
jgi:hypothetical protein